jgi:hypothetical protein
MTGGPSRVVAESNVGGDVGALHPLKDVAPSRTDPRDDLVMPELATPAWQVLLQRGRPETDVLNVLKGVLAWQAAGRMRRQHRLPLWPNEEVALSATLPAAFPLSRQSGADEEELRHRINHLEHWAFDLLVGNRDLSREVLRADELPQRTDSRMAVLRQAAALDESATRSLVRRNELAVLRDAHANAYLEQTRADTRGLIEASARWALALARHFSETCASLGRNAGSDLRQPWCKPQHQGRTAGCVGWAVADLLRSQLRDDKIRPSARYLWHGAKELDGEPRPSTFVARAGTSLRAALHLVSRVGCAVESELPSDSLELYDGSLDQFYAEVSRRKVAAVLDLGMDRKMWLSWLALGRPIVSVIRMNRAFADLNPDEDRLETFDPDEKGLINHAVVIAGWRLAPETFEQASHYDLVAGAVKADSKPITDQTTYFPVEFLVRNTLGERWGNQGHAWVPNRLLRLMAHEAYGVLLAHDEVSTPGAAPARPTWAASDGPAGRSRAAP